jgi:uncharacterized surface protein with fasciclin (FAS1) repeats
MRTREVFGVSVLLSLSILLMMFLGGCECCKKKEPCPKKDACPKKACVKKTSWQTARHTTKSQMKYADSGTKVADKDIIETAAHAKKFKTLIRALEAAELTSVLKEKGPFTVFAPNDKAFAKLPAGTLEDLLKPENKAKLQKILKYHVIPGKVTADDIKAQKRIQTLAGQPIRLMMKDDVLWVDNGRVLMANVPAANGVIHIIDVVLTPEAKTAK